MAISIRNLLLLLVALIASSAAIPTAESPPQAAALPPTAFKARKTPVGPFRRLRDSIIERIWAIPERSAPASSSPASFPAAPDNFRTRYGGDVVLRFQIRNADEAKALSEAADILYLDIWESTTAWVDIRIAKDMVPSFVGLLPASLHDSYRPLMHDLARAVYDTYPATPDRDRDAASSSSSSSSSSWSRLATSQEWHPHAATPHDLFFQDYQPLSVIYPWMRLLASLFPSHAELIDVGASAEGRQILGIRIGSQLDYARRDEHDSRHTILVAGGNHAREWISVSTTAFIAYNMATRYGHPQFPDVTKILDHFDLVFIPVLNPDGYEYTWTTDRLWRKNRQSTSLPFCPGIDVDRSFRFGWDGHGNTDNACSDDYAGSEPLAAVEARILTEWARNQTANNNVTFVSYLDLHSYSQEILYPYSYTCDTEPPNLEDLEEVALGMAKAFRLTNGHFYGVESACEGDITFRRGLAPGETDFQIESQGGSALDFFYHDLDVKLAFQIKLRDTGTYGFLLPRSHIVPTGDEAYEAVMGLGRWLLGNHGIESIHDPQSIWGEDKQDHQEDAPPRDPSQRPSGRHDDGDDNNNEYYYDEEDTQYDDDDYAWELRRRRR